MPENGDSGMLAQAEFFGRMAAESASDVVVTIDQEGCILFANLAIEMVFGFPRDESIGRHFADFLAPRVRDDYHAAFGRYVASGERRLDSWQGVGLVGLHRDGRELPLEVSFSEFIHHGDRFFTAVARNISERGRSPAAGRAGRERYRQLVEDSLGLMCSHDLEGVLLAINPPAAKALGYRPDEMIGRKLHDFMPESVHAALDEYLAAIPDDLTDSGTTRFETRDGRELVWHFQNALCEGSDGSLYVIGHALDLTDQIEAHEAIRDSEKRLQLLVDQMPAVLWTTDRDLIVTSSQGAGLASLELTPNAMTGVSLYEYFDTEDEEYPPIAAHRRALAGDSADYDIDWQGRTFLTHVEPLRSREGKIVGVIGVARDTSDRKRAENEARRALSLVTATLESTADGLLVVDTEGKITSFNRKFAEMWQIPYGVLESGEDEAALAHVVDQLVDPTAFRNRVQALYDQPEAESFDVLDFKDGRVFERFSQPQKIDGEVVGRVWSFRDVTERRKAEKKIEQQAFHDALTGLPNRLLFRDRLEMALAGARRHQQLVAVLFLDLDNFKLVNDTFGHSVGDELLRTVAERLQPVLREGDSLGRLGGDEFTMVLTEVRRSEDALVFARRVLEVFAKPFALSSATIPMTASVGVSVSNVAGEDVEFLLQSADAAMYVAKNRGGNAYHLATSELNLRTWQRASLVNRLRQALDNDALEVHYQPVVDLTTLTAVGVEALVRWRDPDEGLLTSGEFIPMAEESHIIVPIDDWVLETACRDAQAWQRDHPGVRVAVNLSLRQLQQPDLIEKVSRTLIESGLAPTLLELEITESIAMHNADYAGATLRRLRELGVRISIDDFGSGQTSLSHLRHLPVDTLKVDRALVCDVTESHQAAVIVSAILEMAGGLGLETVAEGVESDGQLAFLLQKGCRRAQGFLFSRPLQSAALAEHLSAGAG